jgi:hypothetical protein
MARITAGRGRAGQGASGDRARGTRGRGARGETLAELLVATSLLGIVGVGVIGAIATILIANESDRRASESETVMRNFVAAVEQAPYATCAGPDGPYRPDAIGFSLPTSDHGTYRATIGDARTWNGTGPDVTFTPCGSVDDAGLQRLTLTLEQTAPHRETKRLTATIYKRDPDLS